jgi:predicted aspartyl protease
MGRIVAQVKITNLFEEDKSIQCGMLVDTGAGALILPKIWKEKLGHFKRSEVVELLLANHEVVRGEACWPVEIKIEGFRPVANEVIFVDMEPQAGEDGEDYEPLLGYVILEQAQVAVDMLGHRLVPVKYIDMK